MKTISTLIRSLLVLLAWLSTLNSQLSTAHAQDTAFTYQGRLNDGANPASGIYDLQFTLYDAVTNGTAFGTLTNVATRVSNGLFTTALDFGPGVFTGSNYWLEIAVRTNGGSAFATLAPRQPITPTPYALYASNAGSAVTATMAGSANSVAAANLTGTIADSQLSGNISRLNIPNTNIQATANAVIVSGFIVDTTNLMGGVGYTSNPLVTVTDVSGSNAVITATVANGVVKSLTVQAAGLHYSAGATLTIAPPPSNAYQTFTSGNVFNGVSTFSIGTFGSFTGGTLTLSSNLNLPATTTAAGIIYSGGNTLIHSFGTQNFFAGAGAGNLTMTGVGQNVGIGFNALHSNTSGNGNTASGYTALTGNTTGTGNTANGWGALFSNTSGADNTAAGYNSLAANTTGNQNAALGRAALRNNTTGSANTASGFNALWNNTTGSKNTAAGYQALYSNTNGVSNVANGYQALYANTSASYNTANGDWALNLNTTGNQNTANGHQALNLNTTGSFNTADGDSALHNNTTGSNNIAVGFQAGLNLTNGNNNIDIGNVGVATDTNIIRIGSGQTQAFIAGVITGNGAGLTSLSASQLVTGTIADPRLSANVAFLNGNPNFSGTVTATSFSGNGAGLTSLSANAISGGLTTNIAVLVPGGGTTTLYFTNGVLRAIQ